MTANAFRDALAKRHSQYALGKNLPISKEEVTTLIQDVVKLSPSSFNSQSSRVVILHGAESEKFWGFVKEALRKIVPEDNFASTDKRISGFAAGAGTVLFYEDQDVVKSLQEKFALYAENFPTWSEHSTGMAQLSVWTALANADIGASLQHYNPLVDEVTAAEWNIPATWKMRAQMPFGSNEGPTADKERMSDAERFRVFG